MRYSYQGKYLICRVCKWTVKKSDNYCKSCGRKLNKEGLD